MKIFLFGYFNIPPSMAASKRTMCLAKGLQSAGADVEVDIVHWYFEGGQASSFPPIGVYEGVEYRFVNGEKHYTDNFSLRLDLKYRDNKGAARYILKNAKKGDIIYIYSGDTRTISMLTHAAHKIGCKAVQELVEIPYYSESLSAKYHRWIQEKFVFPKLDAISCISEGLMKYAKEHASKRTKFINVPIMVENNDRLIYTPIYDFPYIIHTGTMHEQKDGISIILKAFAQFKKSDNTGCKLVFAGPHSNEKCSYIPMMKELGIYDDVLLLGMIKDQDRLATLQRYAMMSIVYRFDNIQTRNGFSTKMGEVLMSGAPLITTPIGGHAAFLKNKQNAFIVEPGNVEELVNSIQFISSNPKEAKAVGDEGKNLALSVFNPEYQGKMLYNFFQNL